MNCKEKYNQGVTLIGIIIIVVLLAIVALGIVTYIMEGLRLNISYSNQDKALYMAQAGIMRAVVDYKNDGLWSAAWNVNIGGEFYYHVGQDANFLWVDASSPQVSGRTLKRIPIQNINASSSITITNMEISWTFGGNIVGITLGGTSVWNGTSSSPASIDITDFTVTPGTSYEDRNNQIWQFSNNISGNADVLVNFIFSDGSSYKIYLLKNGVGANKEFSIKATGEINDGTTVEARKTIVATYDTGKDAISSWQESQGHIIP